MKFYFSGLVWCDELTQKELEEQHDFNVADLKKPFDECKSYLTKRFYLDKMYRARLLLKCKEIEVNDWFCYGASYELTGDKINEFKRVVFKTSLPTEGFKYLLLEFPWLSNSDLALNYSLAFPPSRTDIAQAIWAWRRNDQSDFLLNERLLMCTNLDDSC